MTTSLRRLLTTDVNFGSRQNLSIPREDDETTFYGGQSFKQQIDVFSSLCEPVNAGNIASQVNEKNTLESRDAGGKPRRKKKSAKDAQAKKRMQQVYQTLNVTDFVINERNNPYSTFDRKRQKIQLNPGVPYRSTSQNDVFELRN